MIFAPIFSVMWIKLGKSNAEPSSPVKFAIGLAMVGVGFFLLLLGKPLAKEGMIPAIFLAGLYLAHTLGELALSPVGLSLVTKLAPEKVAGLMMGAWFLSSSLAHQAGKWIGEMMFDESKIKGLSAAQSLDSSLAVLTQVGMFAIGSAVVLLILSPILKRWMHGVK
jgi:POT family proton-dependent oligopeptide transporter